MTDPTKDPKNAGKSEKPAAKKPAAAPAKKTGMSIADLTKALIFKKTGQRPILGGATVMPSASTGSVVVDYLIGGTPVKDGKGPVCPGFPRRRLTEVFGGESSGKTTLLLASIAKAQRDGHVAMFLDFEHALHKGYAQSIGVKFEGDKVEPHVTPLIFYQPDTMEEGFQMMLAGIMMGVDLIVVDSVAAMVPAAELEKEIGETAKVGGVAKPMSEMLPKFMLWLAKYPMDKATNKPIPDKLGTALVFINQTRSLINTSGGGGGGAGENTNTTGGKALKFFAYVRLQLTRIGSEFVERVDPMSGKKKRYPYGNQTKVKCIKSKCDAKQGHEVEIFIRYGEGIDNYYSVIQTACAQNIMKKDGSWLTYGEMRLQGRDKWRDYLRTNTKLFEELTKRVSMAVLATADTIPEEELSEEEHMLAAFNAEMGGTDDEEAATEAEVAEIILQEGVDPST